MASERSADQEKFHPKFTINCGLSRVYVVYYGPEVMTRYRAYSNMKLTFWWIVSECHTDSSSLEKAALRIEDILTQAKSEEKN